MITQLINENLINLNLKATSKDDVFKELIEILYQQGRINNKEHFLADVLAREELGNTGFEDGVALPHARLAGQDRTVDHDMGRGADPDRIPEGVLRPRLDRHAVEHDVREQAVREAMEGQHEDADRDRERYPVAAG